MIALAFALARFWVRLYTRGVPLAARDARRAELDCDLWEQRHDGAERDRRPVATAFEVLSRVVRGVPSDLAWRLEHRARGSVAARLRHGGATVRRHRWTVFPALTVLGYVTGAAKLGTPTDVGTPEQVAMAAGAAAMLCGLVLLWRDTAPIAGAWLVCLGALGPEFLIAPIAPLSLLWAALAMRSAVRRSDELRARFRPLPARRADR